MSYEEILKKQFDEFISNEKLDGISEGLNQQTMGLSDSFSLEALIETTLAGESVFNNTQVIDTVTSLILLEVKSAAAAGIEILVITVISGLLNCITQSFNSKSSAKAGSVICTMAIAGIAVNSLNLTYNLAVSAVETMVNTMIIILPALITVLYSTGMITSGTVFSPVISAATTGFNVFIETFILPALFASAILAILNSLTEKDYVNNFSKLLRSAAVFITGLIVTLMTGVISLQGLLTESTDNLFMNAAKYSISSFIPLVGGFTADTAELFMKCMGTIKGVVGAFGIIMLILMVMVPVIKIMAIAAVYKLISAAAEPVTDKKLSDGLNSMGNSMISICAVLFFAALMYILFISVIISVGGN